MSVRICVHAPAHLCLHVSRHININVLSLLCLFKILELGTGERDGPGKAGLSPVTNNELVCMKSRCQKQCLLHPSYLMHIRAIRWSKETFFKRKNRNLLSGRLCS